MAQQRRGWKSRLAARLALTTVAGLAAGIATGVSMVRNGTAPSDAIQFGTYVGSGTSGFIEGFRSGAGNAAGESVPGPAVFGAVTGAEVAELPVIPWEENFATAGGGAVVLGFASRRLVNQWLKGSKPKR